MFRGNLTRLKPTHMGSIPVSLTCYEPLGMLRSSVPRESFFPGLFLSVFLVKDDEGNPAWSLFFSFSNSSLFFEVGADFWSFPEELCEITKRGTPWFLILSFAVGVDFWSFAEELWEISKRGPPRPLSSSCADWFLSFAVDAVLWRFDDEPGESIERGSPWPLSFSNSSLDFEVDAVLCRFDE